MKTYIASLESKSPYSQGRHYDKEDVPALPKEGHDAYEQRTWRNRMHVRDGVVFIPPTAIKNCLAEAAKFLSVQIPGKGKATYTKHFEAGVMVVDEIPLGYLAADAVGERLFVPSSGRRGDGKRVQRIFPMIPKWKADVTIHVLDETITCGVLEQHLREAGTLIGIGRFRPRNNGYYGRFTVTSLTEAAS